MHSKFLRVVALALMLLGVSVIAAPVTSEAVDITITSVTVTVGATNFSVWTFPVTLTPGQSLLLSQTGTTANAYNFDTSDVCIPASNCPNPPTIAVNTSVGTFTFTDTSKVLSLPSVPPDTNTNPPQETREFVGTSQTGGTGSGLSLVVGYADDAHLQSPRTACTATGTVDTPLVNCRPDPFTASFVQANAVTGGCLAPDGTFDGRFCFDAGVLVFTNGLRVPEPATLLLLGCGLLGIATLGRVGRVGFRS